MSQNCKQTSVIFLQDVNNKNVSKHLQSLELKTSSNSSENVTNSCIFLNCKQTAELIIKSRLDKPNLKCSRNKGHLIVGHLCPAMETIHSGTFVPLWNESNKIF